MSIAHIISSHLRFDLIEMYLLVNQRLKCIHILIGLTIVELVKPILTILERNISPAKL